jgi:formylglycine-generating enzyme required for sulfatase activity
VCLSVSVVKPPHLRSHPLALGGAPAWAEAWGEDDWGVYAVERHGAASQRYRWIPPDRFRMGSPEDEEGRFGDEGPQHEVRIPEGFWLGEVPVTQALYEAVMGTNPSHFAGKDMHPVEQVSWDEARAFCERAGAGIRLPTEAEWEHACRAGTTGPSYAPGTPLEDLGWYEKNSNGSTQPVGLKRANAWGLHDMLGNVYEWCLDPYAPYAGHARTDTHLVNMESRVLRVIRGGSWLGRARGLRPACRGYHGPARRWRSLGFRLLRGPAPGPEAEEQGPEAGGARPAVPRRAEPAAAQRAERSEADRRGR